MIFIIIIIWQQAFAPNHHHYHYYVVTVPIPVCICIYCISCTIYNLLLLTLLLVVLQYVMTVPSKYRRDLSGGAVVLTASGGSHSLATNHKGKLSLAKDQYKILLPWWSRPYVMASQYDIFWLTHYV